MGIMSNRLNWIDILKGIAIILVVLGHTLDGAPMYNTTSWMRQLHSFIYAFHMPLFFFLSGCTFTLSKRNSEKRAFSLRLLELFLVYVIWSFFMYVGKSLFAAEATNQNKFSFPYCLIFAPVDPFWYLIVLLFYSAIGVFVLKANKTVRMGIFACACIVSAAISVWKGLAIKNGAELRYLYRIVYHFAFFTGGICFIKNEIIKLDSNLLKYGLLVLTSVLFFIKLFFKLNDVILLNEVIAWACILLLVAFINKLKSYINDAFLAFLGQNTLYIYCLHNFITVACRIFLKDKINNGGGYICIVFILTMAICFIAIMLIRKIKILDILFKPVKPVIGLKKSKEE